MFQEVSDDTNNILTPSDKADSKSQRSRGLSEIIASVSQTYWRKPLEEEGDRRQELHFKTQANTAYRIVKGTGSQTYPLQWVPGQNSALRFLLQILCSWLDENVIE